MNKLLTLYDMEFRRVKKNYFSLLSLLILGNIILFNLGLYLISNKVEEVLNIRGGLEIFKSDEAYRILQNEESIYTLYNISFLFMVLSFLWCIYYAIKIWHRDFFNKTNLIYTFFTLPTNRFNIFLSKFLTIISLVYGIVVIQHFIWIIQMALIKYLTNIDIETIIDIINFNSHNNVFMIGALSYPMEIIMNYFIAPIVIVAILFTGIMINKSFDKLGFFLGSGYVILAIAIYILNFIYYITFTDELLKVHIFYCLFACILSIVISYQLVNKKVHV